MKKVSLPTRTNTSQQVCKSLIMQLRSGRIVRSINTDLLSVHETLRKNLPTEKLETYVRELLSTRFYQKLRNVLSSPIIHDEQIRMVLSICTNICFTSDKNIDQLVEQVPELIPTLIDLIGSYQLKNDAFGALANLAAHPKFCIQLIDNYGLLDRIHELVFQSLESESPLELSFYLCQLVFNLSDTPLMTNQSHCENLSECIYQLIRQTSDLESLNYLFHAYRNLPTKDSRLMERFSKRLNRYRRLVFQVEAEHLEVVNH
jgi:Txe/YoeB family toxin of Txe-Axe toxin-antitoxin module